MQQRKTTATKTTTGVAQVPITGQRFYRPNSAPIERPKIVLKGLAAPKGIPADYNHCK